MLVEAGPSGFYRSSVSKALILTSCVATAGVTLAITSQRIGATSEMIGNPTIVLRLLSSQFVSEQLHDCITSSIVLYTFRVFERRYGSRKFSNSLFSSAVLSTCIHIGVLAYCRSRRISLQLASGPYAFVFSLLVPFFLDIPSSSSPVIPFFTLKTFVYLLAGQLALSQGVGSLICSITGLLSGILWRFNILSLQQWLVIPTVLSNAVDAVLSPFLTSLPPSNLPRGATLQIQREQYLDDQERLMAMLSQQVHQRHPRQGDNQQLPSQTAMTHQNIQEQQVQQLMEMGFTRQAATQALSSTDNNLELAMNILVSD